MSETPTCYNVGNGAVASSECRWNQIDGANILQNNMPPVWNQFTTHRIASVPVAYNECSFASSGSQSWSDQLTVGIQISQSPGCSKKPGAVKKPKRYRTAFTTQQVLSLEAEYARNRYLDRLRRLDLAELLGLDERALKIWFQNRRMKEKKDGENSADTTSTSECSEEGNSYIPIPIHEHQYLPVTSNSPVITATSYPTVSCPPPAMPSYVPPTMPASWLPPAMPESYLPHSLPMLCQNEYQQTFQSSETEFLELEPEVVPILELGRLEPTSSASSEEKDWELSRLLSALYGD